MSLRERTRPGLGIIEPCLPSPAKAPPSGAGWFRGLLLSVLLVPALISQTQAAPPQAVREACSGDSQRLCSGVVGNPEAHRACLREHRSELSPGCKAAIAQSRGRGGVASQADPPNKTIRTACYPMRHQCTQD